MFYSTSEYAGEGDSSLKEAVDVVIDILTVPIPPILIIFGLLGNLFSFLLMNRQKYQKSTTCFYMRCMAGSDCLYIYGRMFLRQIIVMAPHHFESMDVKVPFCLNFNVSFMIGLVLSPMILVVMAFDRFLAVTWPLKAAMICTMRRARITVLVLILFSLTFSLMTLGRTYQEKYNFWLCPLNFEEPIDEIYSTIQATITAFFPMAALAIFNLGILIAVYRSKRNTKLTKTSSGPKGKESLSITLATVIVTCAFIVLQTPHKANVLFWTVFQGEVTADVRQWQRLMNNAVLLTENLNYCINSYLYILASKRLRNEMVNIICPRSIRQK
ncbi:psychosine receptor-like [Lineus longissimus]|uniref:psychosine receptor-like n=1 Tax=Lineus longissimus TaxID=88925 RepID=UPI002B4E4759